MERFTISLDDTLARQFEEYIAERGYGNRSEAIRDLIRQAMEIRRQEEPAGSQCIASLSYVFNHHQRDLSERLTSLQHEHHDLTVASLHSHLDHHHCIESVILQGPTAAVRKFADALVAERGVHHGKLNLICLEPDSGHSHGQDAQGARHTHFHPAG